MRSDSRPAIGATSIGMPVQGSVRRPASSGDMCCVTWKNWASRKIEPKTPKYIANETPLEAAKARERKKRIGSIGAGVRSSQTTNAASRIAPAISEREHRARRPAELGAADDAVDDAQQAEPAEREPAEVEPAARAVGLGEAAVGERGEDEARSAR